MKCDECGGEATVHITEIRRGLSHGRHLCESCAERVLPLEENDYADYLGVLPPKDSEFDPDEGEPTKDELEMTGMREHVIVADLATGAVERPGMRSGDSFSPVWSPDGRRLALCHSANLSPSIVLVEPGTSGFRRTTHTTYGEPASWSRDSRRVVFSHIDDGACVAIAEADGDLLYHLDALEDVGDFHPAWSPVDERIAFVAAPVDMDEDECERCSVVTTPAQGGARRTLARFEDVLVSRIKWSPDAQRLAVMAIPATREESEDIFDATVQQGLRVLRADVEDSTPQRVVRCAITYAWFERIEGFSDGPALGVIDLPRRGSVFRAMLFNPRTAKRIELPAALSFAGSGPQPTHLSRDGRTLATVNVKAPRRVVLFEPASGASRELDAKGEVFWLGWVPQSDDLALLVQDRDATRLDLLSPAGARRTVTRFDRREYFEAPSAALSPDGKRIAVELHAPVAKKF
jgi:Tol biopolymer transport system component